jgi:hypothetical protein
MDIQVLHKYYKQHQYKTTSLCKVPVLQAWNPAIWPLLTMTWNSHQPSDTAAEEDVAVDPLQAPYAVEPELGVLRGTGPEVEDSHLHKANVSKDNM